MKLLVTTALLLASFSVLAQPIKDKISVTQVAEPNSQQQPKQGPGPGPGRPSMGFEMMKKREIERLEKRISIFEEAKSCAAEAKMGPSFGDCMKKMGENHKAEDQRVKAENDKLRAEAERRGAPAQNNIPPKFKIEENNPEVKKK
jgi:hypothetical protein